MPNCSRPFLRVNQPAEPPVVGDMTTPSDIAGFEAASIPTAAGEIFVRHAGSGSPVLLLRGFPETGAMWREIAPMLARDHRVVVADLPGYGRSDPPPDGDGHIAMAKRSMATTLAAAMAELGHARFVVVGHDRGGRVAYRAALDHPGVVTRVAVLDVVPTYDVWARADARLARGFWPFSLLAQPAPLPERLILGDPQAVVDDALAQWGTPPATFPADLRAAYLDALTDPAHVHAICEEYRAAATIDCAHDAADRAAGRRIACPLLALWSGSGALGTWYDDAGGPIGLWRDWAEDVRGHAVAGGHFFPEEYPQATATVLSDFLSG